MNSQNTLVSLLILLSRLLISPLVRLHSPLLLFTHHPKTLLLNLVSYTDYRLLMCHHTNTIITDCSHSLTLSPRLDLSGCLPGIYGREQCSLTIANHM